MFSNIFLFRIVPSYIVPIRVAGSGAPRDYSVAVSRPGLAEIAHPDDVPFWEHPKHKRFLHPSESENNVLFVHEIPNRLYDELWVVTFPLLVDLIKKVCFICLAMYSRALPIHLIRLKLVREQSLLDCFLLALTHGVVAHLDCWHCHDTWGGGF